MQKQSRDEFLKENLYFISISQCIDDINEAVFPMIDAFVDENASIGDETSLSLRLYNGKKEINKLTDEIVKADHLDYFDYVKINDSIHVYFDFEDMHSEIDCRFMGKDFLETMYHFQEKGDVFRKVSRSKIIDFDYSRDSWRKKEEELSKLNYMVKHVLRRRKISDISLFDLVSEKPKTKKKTLF